jgi:hypothetical protein
MAADWRNDGGKINVQLARIIAQMDVVEVLG